MRSEAMTGSAHTTAEPVRVEPEVNASEIALLGPLNLAYSLAGDRLGGGGPVSLGLIHRAGVYQVSGAANLSQLAVNLADEGESGVAVRPEIRISGRDATGTAVMEAAPREIWHWLVLAAIGVLGAEWLLYAWRMRL